MVKITEELRSQAIKDLQTPLKRISEGKPFKWHDRAHRYKDYKAFRNEIPRVMLERLSFAGVYALLLNGMQNNRKWAQSTAKVYDRYVLTEMYPLFKDKAFGDYTLEDFADIWIWMDVVCSTEDACKSCRKLLRYIVREAFAKGFTSVDLDAVEDLGDKPNEKAVEEIKQRVRNPRSLSLEHCVLICCLLIIRSKKQGACLAGLFLFVLGCRPSEALGFKYKNIISFKNGVVCLQRLYVLAQKSRTIELGGKTDNAFRDLPLAKFLEKLLLERIEYLRNYYSEEELLELPISNWGEDYEMPTTQAELNELLAEVFVESGVSKELLEMAEKEMKTDARAAKECDYCPTAYLGRHQFATDCTAVGMPSGLLQMVIGHDITDPLLSREDQTNPDMVYRIANYLNRRPLIQILDDFYARATDKHSGHLDLEKAAQLKMEFKAPAEDLPALADEQWLKSLEKMPSITVVSDLVGTSGNRYDAIVETVELNEPANTLQVQIEYIDNENLYVEILRSDHSRLLAPYPSNCTEIMSKLKRKGAGFLDDARTKVMRLMEIDRNGRYLQIAPEGKLKSFEPEEVFEQGLEQDAILVKMPNVVKEQDLLVAMTNQGRMVSVYAECCTNLEKSILMTRNLKDGERFIAACYLPVGQDLFLASDRGYGLRIEQAELKTKNKVPCGLIRGMKTGAHKKGIPTFCMPYPETGKLVGVTKLGKVVRLKGGKETELMPHGCGTQGQRMFRVVRDNQLIALFPESPVIVMLSSKNDLSCIYSKQITEHGFGTTGVQAYLPGHSLQAAIPAEIRAGEEMKDETDVALSADVVDAGGESFVGT